MLRALLLGIAASILSTGCSSSTPTFPFSIIERDDVSIAGKKRMVFRVRMDVSELPTSEAMTATANGLWKDGNTGWDEFTVFMRLPDGVYKDSEWAKNAIPYSRVDFTPAGFQKLTVQEIALYGSRWQKEQAKAAETPSKYAIDLTASPVGAREIAVVARTNLPDKTNLLLTVNRSYWQQTTDTGVEYAGEIYSKDLPVTNGQIQATVDVNDSVWVKDRNGRKDLLMKMEIWDEIGTVSPDVEIAVLYSSVREQPEGVRTKLGDFGNAKALKSIKVSKSLSIPYRP